MRMRVFCCLAFPVVHRHPLRLSRALSMFLSTYSKRALFMPSLAKGLTDVAVRNAKRKDKRYTLADGGGLHLEVLPSDRKSWFARYRLPDGKQRTVVLGFYPALSLADARLKAEEVRLASRTGGPIVGARAEARMRVQSWTVEQELAEQAAEEAKRYSFTRMSEAWLVSKVKWSPESNRCLLYTSRCV